MNIKTSILLLICLLATIGAKASGEKLYTSDVMSNSLVTSIVQDQHGYVWIGTAYGLNKFDGYRHTAYLHNSDNERSIVGNNISILYVSRKGSLLVGCVNGLSLYNAMENNFQTITFSDNTKAQPRITSFAENGNGDVYVATEGMGLYVLKHGSNVAQKTALFDVKNDDGFYSRIHIDKKNRLWRVDNSHEIMCMDVKGGKARIAFRHKVDVGEVMQLLDDGDRGLFIVCRNGILYFNGKDIKRLDKENKSYNCACPYGNGKIIVGTGGNGFWVVTKDGVYPKPLSNGYIDLNRASISALLRDRGENLWIGCAERGLAFIPSQKSQFSSFSLASLGIKTSGVINDICPAGNNSMYMALSGSGLYNFSIDRGDIRLLPSAPVTTNMVYRDSKGRVWLAADNTFYSMDAASGSVSKKFHFDCIYMRTMTDDHQGKLYLAVFGKGMLAFNPSTGEQHLYSMFQPKHPKLGQLCNDWILHFMTSRDGKIWIATASGLQCFDPATGSFKPYGWDILLDDKPILSLAEDKKGNIAVGTYDGLYIYDKAKRKLERFPHAERLKDLHINYIVYAANGDLWCSTSIGIWRYDNAKKRFQAYMDGNGLSGHEYLEERGLITSSGNVVFATPEGITLFNPTTVNVSKNVALKPVLTEITIGGTTVNTATLSNGDQIIEKPAVESSDIVLAYADNTFSLEFSTFDYANIDNSRIEYSLDGYKWQTLDNGRNAISFAHLPSGKYTLEVRINNNGQLSPIATYTITIGTPWYRSTIAYIIYIIVFLAIVGYISYTYQRRKRVELDEEKMQFLINATHDIRTPLTLILNPLHQLMRQADAEAPENKEKLQTINHNANRILTLVNQILDIRKMDKLQMHLHCQETSLVKLIDNVYSTYDYNAKKRNITFRFDHGKDIKAYVDRSQFDKVVSNLLSNAFKYTDDDGEIVITLSSDENNAIIKVMDNGRGLKEEDLGRIFKRFYQSVNQAAVQGESTGIGLNLCKMIVDMHHGTIVAANRTDQKGSVFTVTIPLGTAHLKPEDIIKPEPTHGMAKQAGTNYRVLLVDDDSEITDYISTELGQYYKFTLCSNGRQAIGELLSEKKFDIVVSDIMMPVMDGFTLLRLIKTNSNISHIPVVLLTSEAAIGNRLEGLDRGADAFLSKPFMMEELKATIDNLISSRLRLKGKFSGTQDQVDKLDKPVLEDNDKELMDRIVKSINKNIGDSDFNVEMLCREACISRTQLHRKMKELTGLSTSEFIRNMRLEQAARLLKERHANVSQVAYTLGFTNTAHFSKVFKQHFGVPPSEYGKHDDVSEEQ